MTCSVAGPATHPQVAKREHPLDPVIHLIDDKGTGSKVVHMGRTASAATASALRSLTLGRKGDEVARKMVNVFTSPKEHADYLTSPM